MSSEQVIRRAEPHGHLLQLYKADERALTVNVGRYLFEGLQQGDRLLVIATADHRESFARELSVLGTDPQTAAREGRLCFRDAEETLSLFMLDGQPDWDSFQNAITGAIRQLVPASDHPGLRAYGDMVGVLWKAGQLDAAIRLEEFWNKLLDSIGFQLFCGYPIDVFDEEFHTAKVEDLLRAHTHLVPIGENGILDSAMNRAAEEILGPGVDELRAHIEESRCRSSAVMPAAEASILWIRKNLGERAAEILPRARHYYEDERRFRALIENSSDAISLFDAYGKVLYASASTVKILGYRPEEIIGRNGLDMIHPDDLGHASRTLQQVLANARCPIELQARMHRKDGQWRWIESTVSNLLDEPDVRAIVWNYRDIGERKAAEEEKQRDVEKLARSNAELQAFAYAAAHDLREPLRTVGVFTELLLQRTQVDEDGKELAGYIVDGVRRMSALLDDLLSLTSLRFGDLTHPVELRSAAEQAIKNLDQAIRESDAMVTLDRLPIVYGNKSHFLEVFQNLIGNAIKYRSEAPIRIHISAQRLGQEWVVKVQDNGVGIAPEYRDHVFGLFKRLHPRETAGTGIGLALCKKIIEGLGGKIWIESAPGNGSTFCFTLAAAETFAELPLRSEGLEAYQPPTALAC